MFYLLFTACPYPLNPALAHTLDYLEIHRAYNSVVMKLRFVAMVGLHPPTPPVDVSAAKGGSGWEAVKAWLNRMVLLPQLLV